MCAEAVQKFYPISLFEIDPLHPKYEIRESILSAGQAARPAASKPHNAALCLARLRTYTLQLLFQPPDLLLLRMHGGIPRDCMQESLLNNTILTFLTRRAKRTGEDSWPLCLENEKALFNLPDSGKL